MESIKSDIHIAIITHDRPELLLDLISSVRKLIDLDEVQVHAVQQLGNARVDKVIQANLDLFSSHIKTAPNESQVELRISATRIAAYEHIFDTHGGQEAIVFEDDIVISPDALVFYKAMIAKHGSDPKYRGINFGSVEPITPNSEWHYFIQRFGLHGPASGISKGTWRALKPHLNSLIESFGHFDLAFEQYLRTGFMISPARSRYLDFGANGTHAGSFDSHYFTGLSRSWVGSESPQSDQEWILSSPTELFRDDCFEYSTSEDFFFRVMWELNLRNSLFVSKLILKFLYKFKYLPKCRKNGRQHSY